MKKEKKRQKKQWLALGSMILMASGLAIGNYLKNDSSVSAKPVDDNPIVVDKGTEKEYSVPFDATKLLEPALTSQSPKFDNYVQNETTKLNLDKNFALGTSTNISDGAKVLNVFSNGNVLILETGGSYVPGDHPPLPEPYGRFVVKSPDGKVIKTMTPEMRGFLYSNVVDNGNGTFTFAMYDNDAVWKIYTYDYELNKKKEVKTNYTRDTYGPHGQISNGSLLVSERVTDKELHTGVAKFQSFDINTGQKSSPFLNLASGLGSLKLPPSGLAVDYEVYDDNPKYYYGVILVQSTTPNAPNLGSYFATWDKGTGNLLNIYRNDYPWGTVRLIQGSKGKYFSNDGSQSTDIVKVRDDGRGFGLALEKSQSPSNLNERFGSSYPKGTTMNIKKIANGYLSVGTISEKKDQFSDLIGKKGIVVTFLDDNFNYLNAVMMEIDNVSINSLDFTDGKTVYFSGSFTQKGGGFLTHDIKLTDKAWPTFQNSFVSKFTVVKDFSPAIKKMNNATIDIDKLTAENKDSVLLSDMSVYDEKDSNNQNIEGKPGQEWLNARINRNPNLLTNPIDWEALGFTEQDKYGPKLVTYFITDSQKQTTSTSRWVNKVNSQTVQNKEGMLGAQNFYLPLEEAKTLNEDKLRADDGTYAQLKAWDAASGESILKRDSKDGVSINPDDLKKITSTTTPGVFPLRLQLTYGSSEGEQPQTRTLSVFVGGTEKDGIWHNIQKSKLPWDVSRNITATDYLTSDDVKNNITEIYDVFTGAKIDASNPTYEVKADVGELNKTDPDPNSKNPKATQDVAVPLSIWIKGGKQKTQLTAVPNTTVYYRTQTVQVKLLDQDNQPLYTDGDKPLDPTIVTLADKIVGKSLVLSTEATVDAAVKQAGNANGYKFINYFKEDNKTLYPATGMEVPKKETGEYVLYAKFEGQLDFIQVPKAISFKTSQIKAQDQDIPADSKNQPITIRDHRKVEDKNKKGWALSARLTQEFVSGKDTLSQVLYYDKQLITGTKAPIEAIKAKTMSTVPLNDTGKLHLKVPSGMAKKGTYQAEITWELTTGP